LQDDVGKKNGQAGGVLDRLGLLKGTTPKSVPLYLRTSIGSNVAAGLYP